jgi:hypothetical protein
VLPGPILIADRGNNRLIEVDPYGRLVWEFPRPGDLAPHDTFKVPDDAFFTPDGKQIIATLWVPKIRPCGLTWGFV